MRHIKSKSIAAGLLGGCLMLILTACSSPDPPPDVPQPLPPPPPLEAMAW
jgi:hypothetical protein